MQTPELSPITYARQNNIRAGCVPTSLAMVLSGFGVATTESKLTTEYFPSAMLNCRNHSAGVMPEEVILGMGAALRDYDLTDKVKLDIYEPDIWRQVEPKTDTPVIKIIPKDIEFFARKERYDGMYYIALLGLAEEGKINIYTLNRKLPQTDPDLRIFYPNLADFIKAGHSLGAYNLGTIDDFIQNRPYPYHAVAVDGTKTTKTSFTILDPSLGVFEIPHAEFITMPGTEGVRRRGRRLVHLWRLSPNKDTNTKAA